MLFACGGGSCFNLMGRIVETETHDPSLGGDWSGGEADIETGAKPYVTHESRGGGG